MTEDEAEHKAKEIAEQLGDGWVPEWHEALYADDADSPTAWFPIARNSAWSVGFRDWMSTSPYYACPRSEVLTPDGWLKRVGVNVSGDSPREALDNSLKYAEELAISLEDSEREKFERRRKELAEEIAKLREGSR